MEHCHWYPAMSQLWWLAHWRRIHQWKFQQHRPGEIKKKLTKKIYVEMLSWVILLTPFLTHCGLVMPYGSRDLGQHWFRLWLVAWRHQAITWTNVDLSSLRSSDVHLRAILLEISQPSVTKISLKIIFLRFHWNLPGANELTQNFCTCLHKKPGDAYSIRELFRHRYIIGLYFNQYWFIVN